MTLVVHIWATALSLSSPSLLGRLALLPLAYHTCTLLVVELLLVVDHKYLVGILAWRANIAMTVQ